MKNVVAKSRRTRARLTYIEDNAIPALKQAVQKGEISIYIAERIAHSSPEHQELELGIAPRSRAKSKDPKLIEFPCGKQAQEEGVSFTDFQLQFDKSWNKLARRYARVHGYTKLWEMAETMVARASVNYSDEPRKRVR